MTGRRVRPDDTPLVTFGALPLNDGPQILVGFLSDGTPVIYCHDTTLSYDVAYAGLLDVGRQILAAGGSLVSSPSRETARWN